MGPGKMILIAIMAGIYSGILDGVENHYGLHSLVSTCLLILLTYITGYTLYYMRKKR